MGAAHLARRPRHLLQTSRLRRIRLADVPRRRGLYSNEGSGGLQRVAFGRPRGSMTENMNDSNLYVSHLRFLSQSAMSEFLVPGHIPDARSPSWHHHHMSYGP